MTDAHDDDESDGAALPARAEMARRVREMIGEIGEAALRIASVGSDALSCARATAVLDDALRRITGAPDDLIAGLGHLRDLIAAPESRDAQGRLRGYGPSLADMWRELDGVGGGGLQ